MGSPILPRPITPTRVMVAPSLPVEAAGAQAEAYRDGALVEPPPVDLERTQATGHERVRGGDGPGLPLAAGPQDRHAAAGADTRSGDQWPGGEQYAVPLQPE